MSLSRSSAQYRTLYRYADVAGRIDHELAAQASSLGATLHHFESTCRESGCALNVSYLADALRAYAQAADPVDRWVQAVGQGFEQADRQGWRIGDIIRDWVYWVIRPRQELVLWWEKYQDRRIVVAPDGPFSAQAGKIMTILPSPQQGETVTLLGLLMAFMRIEDALRQALLTIRHMIFMFRIYPFFDIITVRLPKGIFALVPTPVPTPALDPPSPTIPDEPGAVENPTGDQVQDPPWTKEIADGFVSGDQGRLPGKESCVTWAKDRSRKVSGMILPAIGLYNENNQGACNYIDIYADSVIKFSSENAGQTLDRIGPGAVLIYDKGQAGANSTYGHVAIVEKVEDNGIWVSDSSWSGSPRFIPTSKLVEAGLYVIPAGSQPVSKERFSASARQRGV